MTTIASYRSRRKPTRISFFGHFGTRNFGNESTLLAILARLRQTYPDCEFSCICSKPDVVSGRDGIEAVPITTRTARIWDRDRPLPIRLLMMFVGVAAELGQFRRAFGILKDTDVLIVPGTGLLTDAYGLSAWGPYNLFKWSLTSRLRGCRLLFVSVGVGPLDSKLGRFLVKAALHGAHYRSYRDVSSLNYLQGVGFRNGHDRVYPDLVFSLPRTLIPDQDDRPRSRRVVGLGVMLYAGKYSVPSPRDTATEEYLESLSAFVEWLLAKDYDVRLLIGDADTDLAVREQFESLLRVRSSTAYDDRRVIVRPLTSVQELFSEIAATDVLVATRFHNVIMALILNKPVIAISFHHKCSSLMSDMGLRRYCHDINEMDAHRLIEQFEQLEANREEVRHSIALKVADCSKALDEQYALLFGD
jgi:polysaccharide pyruvyl transferase WcaK-like protein